VEVTMAGLFVVVAAWASSWAALVVGLVLTALLVLIVIYDIEHLIIPNELVALIAGLSLIPLGLLLYQSPSYELLLWAAVSSVTAASVYAFLWYISGGRWIGFGDVKLAAALGLWLTPASAVSMVIFSFWIGAVIGSLLLLPPLLVRVRNRLYPRQSATYAVSSYTMKSEIPFAPFIVAAFGIVYVYDFTAIALITSLLEAVF